MSVARTTGGWRRRRQALRSWCLVLMVVALAVAGGGPAAAQAPGQAPAFERLHVTAGRSLVLTTEFDVTTFSLTDPGIANAVVVQPRELLIDGRAPGTISLIIWGAGQRVQYDVVVEQPVPALEQQLRQLFPSDEISVTRTTDGIILSGRVSSTQSMLRAAEVASATSPGAAVINMLQVPGAAESQQVMLQVRFAEVNRRAITELGVSLFTGAGGINGWVGRTTTGQVPAPAVSPDDLVLSDLLNIFLFNTEHNAGAIIRALRQSGYFQSLAEPNLVAYNGREASFLAGGEFPVPLSSGLGQTSVQYREFGIRLTFTPTIAGDLIRLNVRPEVSSLDFNNGVLLEGFRIPALTMRRAETEVELRDGQSFAIAGLIDNETQIDDAAIPLLSQIPILGNLFKSKADRQQRTELLVLITPRLVRPLDPDEVPPLPTLPGRFLPVGDDLGSQLQGGGGPIDGPALR